MSDTLWKHVTEFWAESPTARPSTQLVVQKMAWPTSRPRSSASSPLIALRDLPESSPPVADKSASSAVVSIATAQGTTISALELSIPSLADADESFMPFLGRADFDSLVPHRVITSSPNYNQVPYSPQPNLAAFPALHLYPIDNSFVSKRIVLEGDQHVKIGRQTSTETNPGEKNGYFDSEVLSRHHAEVVWEEAGRMCCICTTHEYLFIIGQIFIKDVKSSNGTFINGERLSFQGYESDPTELKSDDILEFGVDLVSEDNKTVLHRKVIARVACVFPDKGGNTETPLVWPDTQSEEVDNMLSCVPNSANTFRRHSLTGRSK
ncbi:SMAD/FHA domain-containing protein [Mycena galopus ATCC 62051]|nr:SMAD/FHA domain-containing protein [Mycena galopus ATCC 62051]